MFTRPRYLSERAQKNGPNYCTQGYIHDIKAYTGNKLIVKLGDL